jgi:hypothetical protein
LKLFDTRDHDRLAEVSSGRFFRPVNDDPDRYEIMDDGLQLALGIWLVDALEKEHRNRRDPFGQLDIVLEPITSLDITSEIIATALEVSCLKESCPFEVSAALIRHYIGLQNVSENRRTAFNALVRMKPKAFITAMHDSALSADSISTSDWLYTAILWAREDNTVMEVLRREIPEWLSLYSLQPERAMFKFHGKDTAEEVAAERQRVQERIDRKARELTDAERTFIEKHLTEYGNGDLIRLHRQAFLLLAGLPLESFAPSLFAWALGNSLNPAVHASHREFEHLLRFNNIDWKKTRAALKQTMKSIGSERSSVGDWAVVASLRATGQPEDASEAEQLVEELTKHHERFRGWRLVENYCATDPCNPASPKPENIVDTAKQYRSIQVENLFLHMGHTQEDHFFSMAMPGIARFEPEAGVETIRRLFSQTHTRESFALRQAVLSLLPFSVLIERPGIEEFVLAATTSTADAHDDPRDEWLTAQFSLFIAMPHLTGDEQLRALSGLHTSSILLGIIDTLKPGDPALAEALLDEAVSQGDTERQIRLLAAIRAASIPMTGTVKDTVTNLMSSPDKHVRTQALGIASDTEDDVLLRWLAGSDWDSGRLTSEDDAFERWYGSAVLVAAAHKGFLQLDAALDRIALTHYGFAADRLGATAASAVADRIQLALARVIELTELTDLPEIEQRTARSASSSPPLVEVREDLAPAESMTALSQSMESDTQFRERERRLDEAYRRFNRELTNADAQLIVTDLTLKGMTALIAARPDVVGPWYDLLLHVDRTKKRSLQLFASQFAGAIAEEHSERAVTLFRAYDSVDPLVRHVVGRARIPVEVDMMWSLASIPAIGVECISRLDKATSDRELAIEVLAAFHNGQQTMIASFIDQLLASDEPAQIARGLTVAGYSDESDFATAALDRFKDAEGFVGAAWSAAKQAYERNIWSRHWYRQLAASTSALDFWRNSVLLTKIVDARFDLWAKSQPSDTTLMRSFFPTIEGEIRQRIKKWAEKRKDKLFGEKAPNIIFLVRDFSAS